MTNYYSRIIVLFVILAAFWLAMSGLFKPLLLGLGAVSCMLVAWITLRKNLLEDKSVLEQLHWGKWCRYKLWLVGQIARSTVDVAVRIIHPGLPISPVVGKVPADLSELGKVIYANSITLTPGTVSIDIADDGIVVHSLTREGLDEFAGGEMHRRVRDLEN